LGGGELVADCLVAQSPLIRLDRDVTARHSGRTGCLACNVRFATGAGLVLTDPDAIELCATKGKGRA
jgi:hypothetical protein